MALSLPNQIEPLTPADAVEVEHNNTHLTDYINTEIIARTGQVAMTAPLQLVSADPLSDDHAVRKAYVDAFLPIGVMLMYGSLIPPSGKWALCDGSSLQAAAFPKLFAVLQYSYGGSGGTFALPDMRHRVPVGADIGDTRFSMVGKTGGSYDAVNLEHTHAIDHNHASFNSGNQSADHTHTINHDHAVVDTSTDYPTVKYTTVHVDSTQSPSAFAVTTTASPGSIGQGSDFPHKHTVNLPNYTGSSAKQSANHTHAVDVPAFVGTSGKSGTVTAQQVPPYVTISYIIRTD
jgi:microcystin-dependent protein